MLSRLEQRMCNAVARYLQRASRSYKPFSVTDPERLSASLRRGDVLLIEGNQRISVAVKYLTQSTWSHAAMYIGDALPAQADGSEPDVLIEADLSQGVVAVPLSKYAKFSTRICRAVGLSEAERRQAVKFMVDSLGKQYDLRNVIDLMRYLLPTPPVPVRLRRRMLSLGSGDPTRAICSTLIAQAFQSIRYPILPQIRQVEIYSADTSEYTVSEILHIRHHSLFAPRDFDLSPYFQVVKPTIEKGFNHRDLQWHDEV